MSGFGIYNSIAKIPSCMIDVSLNEHFPVIQKEDIDKGYMIRYFAGQANHGQPDIVEIDQQTFERLQSNAMFKVISLEWRISGALDDVPGPQHINSPTRVYTGVITANTFALKQADQSLPGMIYRITNPTQFWIGK
jgi:hypothetical protein